MKKFLLIILVLITLFSCIEENGSLNEEIDLEEQEDIIRNTICYNLESDFDSILCKNEICDTGMCVTYENIWKEILIEMNNLDNEYFNDHITVCKTQIHEWSEGFSYRAQYILTHDWAETSCSDVFIIKIHADNNHYPDVNLSRGSFLTKQEIITAIYLNAFNCNITKISNSTELKYNSMISALKQVIDSAKVDTLCYGGIGVDRETGNLNLRAGGEYLNEYNSCIFGYIDLFTGEIKTEDSYCFIED